MSRKNTPFFVTILSAVALILVVLNAIRLIAALLKWDLLLSLMPEPGPLYLLISGSLWALGWLGVYLGIYFSQSWSRPDYFIFTFLYISYYWLDRFFLQPINARSNATFSLALTLILLFLTVIILALPRRREYFYE